MTSEVKPRRTSSRLAMPALLLAAGLALSSASAAQAVLPAEERTAGLWYTN